MTMNTEVMLANSVNAISIATPNAGSVLVLLNTLYTSGFIYHSPSQPPLSGRTMHTLYAVSFVIYSMAGLSDWIFAYCTLRGYVTSYPLKTGIVVALVSTAVAGSMLNALLLILCVENAFAHRLDVSPYRSGFALITETFFQWIQAFNNFRIVFLFMTLHDLPLSIINFVFITACRCVGPKVWQWPLIVTTITTTMNIVWRLIMLYIAYQRLVCPIRKNSNIISVAQNQTFFDQMKANMSQQEGGRLNEYDECWPIRYSVRKIFGNRNDAERLDDLQHISLPPARTARGVCCNMFIMFAYKILIILVRCLRSILCILLTISIYIISILTFCSPCCYHYICGKQSFYHRHKCSRSFIRYFSQCYHYVMFTLSLVIAACLFSLNVIMLSSVHALGYNQIPYEISHICITVNLPANTIRARLETGTIGHLSNESERYVCKPIWEDGGFGLGINRLQAGPWQTRLRISERKMLAISTKIFMDYSDRQNPQHTLAYDYALLQLDSESNSRFSCIKNTKSNWVFLRHLNELPWPYYTACEKTWTIQKEELIDCSDPDGERKDLMFF